MPFCPKCWTEYPKGFATCEVCELPLTEVPPDPSAHKEGHKESTPAKAPAKSDTQKKKK